MRRAALVLVVLAAACRRTDPPSSTDASAPAPSVVKEVLPRCLPSARELAVAGDDVVVGEAVLTADAVLVGVVRREGGKRVAGVLRAPLDLASSTFTELGPSLGDDPPPVPYAHGADVVFALYARKKDAGDAGPPATRELRLLAADGKPLGAIAQQADESTAFDVAWSGDGAGLAPLVAWDEDAPIAIGQFLADRGTVKVQVLGSADKPKTIPPYGTDAEQPKLLARDGGFWLAWVARRGESEPDSGTFAPEGPGEKRDHRWVEIVALDAKGDTAGPIRRVSPDKGRVVGFELARGAKDASGGAEVLVLVQDEAALGDGAGARILRYGVHADRVDGADLVDGGVGQSLADVVGAPGAPRFVAWTDPSERAHLLPLGPGLVPTGPASVERALDRGRVLGASNDAIYGVASEKGEGGGRVVLRKLLCK